MNEGLRGGGMGTSNGVSVMIKETSFKPLCIGKKYIVCREACIITKVHMATKCGRKGGVLGNFIKNKLKIIKGHVVGSF
jgi:hypothetical protein